MHACRLSLGTARLVDYKNLSLIPNKMDAADAPKTLDRQATDEYVTVSSTLKQKEPNLFNEERCSI